MIQNMNYANQVCHLVSKETGEPIDVGDEFDTRRGGRVKVLGGSAPHKPSSTGRVHVQYTDEGFNREFFPSVIDAEWVVVEG